MKIKQLKLIDFVNKGFLKQVIPKNDLDIFKIYLETLLKNLNSQESEEHNKNIISDFLKSIFQDYKINTSERLDLTICNKDNSLGVIIETRSLKNKNEFPTKENIKTPFTDIVQQILTMNREEMKKLPERFSKINSLSLEIILESIINLVLILYFVYSL